MKKRKMSLRTELLIGTIGSMLIVAIFLSISYMFVMKQIEDKATVNSVRQTMETLNEEVSGILKEYNDLVVDLSNVIPGLQSREQMKNVIKSMGRNMMEETLLYYATYEQIWDGGTLISHSGWEAPGDFDMQSRLWHKNAVNNQSKVNYTEPFTDANTGKIIVTLSYRVLDDSGKLIGVAAADIVLDALSEAVKNIKLSRNSKINLVTKDGLYLTNDDFSAIMNKNYFDSVSFKSVSESTYLDGTPKSFIENGTFYGVHPIENTDWFIVVEGPETDFSDEYIKLIAYVFIGLGIIVAVMLVVDIILSNRVSKGFKTIASGCDLIAKGDFSKKYPDSYTKELSLLANGFNLFSDRLQSIIGSMRQSKVSLNDAGEKLGNTTSDVMAAIEQISVSIRNLGGNLKSQNMSVEQTSQSVKKILDSIHSLEILLSDQAESVQGASTAVEQMIGNISEVNRSVDKMAVSFGVLQSDAQDGAKTQSELQAQIGEIEKQSKLLSEANAVIANIASQTNLLAMNAAIEAAHAGESGKGFAVVADEIRKLSVTSSTQSKTIGEQLKRIQSTIGTVVEATQRGVQGYAHLANEIHETDTLVQQIKAAMTEQQVGSAQITEALHGMNERTHQVQDASQTMITDSRAIMDAVGVLHKETDMIKQGMDEMGQSAEKIQVTGDALSEISVLMDNSIGEIGRQVDQFEV
ncbi:MAG: hypothetical protein J5597_01865 [Spirochaetaceae bacterium]|nr:hypothetical protein [Spirochaetaceae bacterium]